MKELIALMQERGALRFDGPEEGGQFRLASGQLSDYYADCKLLTLNSSGIYQVAHWLTARIVRYALGQRINPQELVLAAVPVGADALLGAVLFAWSQTSAYRGGVEGCLIRKEAKTHGTGGRIIGKPVADKQVILVEDVVTTAGSVCEAIDVLVADGAQVRAVFCIVDREQGGQSALQARDVELHSLVTGQELIAAKEAGHAPA